MKKDKKALRWLYGEIPELVAKGILSEDAASKLKEYYGEVKNADPLRVVALAQIAFVGSIIARHENILWRGKTFKFKTAPVDPLRCLPRAICRR